MRLLADEEKRFLTLFPLFGCNVYITKPVEYEQFAEVIRTLGLFLSIVQMPVGT